MKVGIFNRKCPNADKKYFVYIILRMIFRQRSGKKFPLGENYTILDLMKKVKED